MDEADAYWAAKLVMRFDRPLLEAIVAQGRLSDPSAAAYLVDTLLARRDAIGKAFLDAVTPLDDFRLGAGAFCTTDLATRYRLAARGTVEWLQGSRVVARAEEQPNGRVCVALPHHERYTIYRLRVRRGNSVRPPMEVHFKGGPRPRILGILRVAG
jgi:hypothetical protein